MAERAPRQPHGPPRVRSESAREALEKHGLSVESGVGAGALATYRRISEEVTIGRAAEALVDSLAAAANEIERALQEADAAARLAHLDAAFELLVKLIPHRNMPPVLQAAVAAPEHLDAIAGALDTVVRARFDCAAEVGHGQAVEASAARRAERWIELHVLSEWTLHALATDLLTLTWSDKDSLERRASREPAARLIRCRVLSNYGGFKLGAVVEVDVEEARRAPGALRPLDPRDAPTGPPRPRYNERGKARPADVATKGALWRLAWAKCADPGEALAALLVESGVLAVRFADLRKSLRQAWRRVEEDRAAEARGHARLAE